MKTGLSLPTAKSVEPLKPAAPPSRPSTPSQPKPPIKRPAPADEILDLDAEPVAEEPAEEPAPAPEQESVPEPVAETAPEAEPLSEPAPEPEPEPAAAETKAARPAPAAAAPENATPAPQPARNSPVYIAAVAGAALGTVSVLAVYLLLRPDTTTGAHSGESPFSHSTPAPASAPSVPVKTGAAPSPSSPPPLLEAPVAPAPAPAAPAVAPAPAAEARPSATFAAAPRVVVAGEAPAKPDAKAQSDDGDEEPAAPAPKKAKRGTETARRPAKAKAPQGPSWDFEGVVFDLLTARGVFAAKLIYLDSDGNDVGQTETGPGGRYKVSLPVSTSGGYTLKIVHSDYTTRYIDEGDATSSLREATAEERQILMQAAARNLPWVGNPKKSLHRDLALVPKSPEEP
jgi:hypothetical protein